MLLVIVVVESGYGDTILVDCSMQVLVVTDRCTYTFFILYALGHCIIYYCLAGNFRAIKFLEKL